MWARAEGKPVWRLLSEMTPEAFVRCLDFRYVSDAITRDEALAIVRRNAATRAERIERLRQSPDGGHVLSTKVGRLLKPAGFARERHGSTG